MWEADSVLNLKQGTVYSVTCNCWQTEAGEDVAVL